MTNKSKVAVIGTGNIGTAIAANLVKGNRPFIVADRKIEKAKELGATDREIHDTVLIAAAFCMFNRYVDGLATWAPTDREIYAQRAKIRAEEGYINIDLYKK